MAQDYVGGDIWSTVAYSFTLSAKEAWYRSLRPKKIVGLYTTDFEINTVLRGEGVPALRSEYRTCVGTKTVGMAKTKSEPA